ASASVPINAYFPQIVCVFGCSRVRVNQTAISSPPKILQTRSRVQHRCGAVGERPCLDCAFTASELILRVKPAAPMGRPFRALKVISEVERDDCSGVFPT